MFMMLFKVTVYCVVNIFVNKNIYIVQMRKS